MTDEDPKPVRVVVLEDGERPRSVMLAGAAVAFGFAVELAAILRDELAPPPPRPEPPPLHVLLPPALNRHERRKQKAEQRRRHR